ncbi:MAG: trypsin-like peptidase domain-containing protein [Candidatus Gastranaerophilales bacterium]|nr:trypsin-like peptidase domain-containing protein [Candidatus Gastranaerophilales bacterium]
MEYHYIEKRYNIMGLTSIDAFAGIKGGLNGNCKDVYFLRAIGANASFSKDIASMDEKQTNRMQLGQGVYNRVGVFPKNIDADMAARYMGCYRNWLDAGREKLFTIKLDESSGVGELLGNSCKKVLEVYHNCNPNLNESIEKNFVVKLLYWLDELAFAYLNEWDPRKSMKFVAQGVTREQEYLFCYVLTLLGIDVLLLQNEADIDKKLEDLHLSKQIILGEKKAVALDIYDRQKYAEKKESIGSHSDTKASESGQTQTRTETQMPRVVIPPGRHGTGGNSGTVRQASGGTNAPSQRELPPVNRATSELGFEELAMRASSVVMIAIHNERGDIIGSGSGIMIGRDGYILTNNHVARGGRFYSVRIENDDNMYKTEDIIKYNSLLDLAVIRIDRTLQPLPIYRGGKPLVRGQKVVAIGSPLGLFNSVSDGIISGFRRVNDVDMIQFTAPISHGSSGGAVLNMYGEVIGVSTAGFDEGQNINLAVGYEFINTFIKGFQ